MAPSDNDNSKDTANAFRKFKKLITMAKRASTPTGYGLAKDGVGLSAAVVGVSFAGTQALEEYDPEICSETCNKNPQCSAFNICMPPPSSPRASTC